MQYKHPGVILALMLLTLAPSLPALAISDEARQQGIPTLAPMLEQVTPAVVSIRVSKTVPTSGRFEFRGRELPEEMQRYFENLPNRPRAPRVMGAGSGVIVDAEVGYIVTNHHVVAGAASINVQLSDGRTMEGELLGSDPSTDLALLRIDGEDLTAIEFASLDTVQVGDYAVAIGNPFGIGQTVTSGIVSALGRAGLNRNNYEDFIQTDAAINQGNSGGALVDLEGRLIGINTAIISGSGGSNGVGFAVPVDMVSPILDHLQRDGEVRRGLLGVTIVDVNPAVSESLELDIAAGALVTSVVPDSAAELAGLQVSDVIVAVDDVVIETGRDLRNAIGLLRRGETVALSLVRDNARLQLEAVIGGPDGEAIASGESVDNNFRGAVLRSLSPNESEWADAGLLVESVVPGSQAAAGGLREGDVIVGANRQQVADLQAFSTALADSDRLVALTIVREGATQLLFIN